MYYLAGDDFMEVELQRRPRLSLSVPRRLFTLRDRKLVSDAGYDMAADGRFLMLREAGPDAAPHIVVMINGTRVLASAR